MNSVFTKILISAFLLFRAHVTSQAQPAPAPYHRQAYSFDSGRHNGTTAETAVAMRHLVNISGAPWMQLHIAAYNLGQRSYLSITSLKDGSTQRLDAKSLPQWANSTAYFNGDSVEVTLYVAPGEENIFIRIGEVTVGDWVQSGSKQESICGATDDRVASNDPRAGRIFPVGCTGWIISNGAHLTAGHCVSSAMQTFEFNVPPSQANGTVNHPPAVDQYPINLATVMFANNDRGDDWAIFATNRNANTNQLPAERQQAFYRMSRDVDPPTVRVTGFGLDGPGPSPACPTCDFGATGPQDATNQTQQTHAGHNDGETITSANRIWWEYHVDTQPANSGSPIMIDGTTITIGIHTNGNCTQSDTVANAGTSFENDSLENAINTFVANNTRHVDVNYPLSHQQEGSALRPFYSITAGKDSVPPNGILSVVTGTYEAVTIDKAMTITAPVGVVTIGP
jgi:hypothetical protein